MTSSLMLTTFQRSMGVLFLASEDRAKRAVRLGMGQSLMSDGAPSPSEPDTDTSCGNKQMLSFVVPSWTTDSLGALWVW